METFFTDCNALIRKPTVQIFKVFKPGAGRKQPFPDILDLLFHLAFFPTGCWCAGNRFQQIMTAQLSKAAIKQPVLTLQDLAYRNRHVVVNTSSAGATKEGERPFICTKYHFSTFPKVRRNEEKPAMAQQYVHKIEERRKKD